MLISLSLIKGAVKSAKTSVWDRIQYMLNITSLDAVKNASFGANNVHPLYESYCFANVPGSVLQLLTGHSAGLPQLPPSVFGNFAPDYDNVVLCFIDAFGWRFIEQFAQHPLIQRFMRDGAVSKLTSMFPATTAAHVTTINTGLNLAQSGVHEWFYYEPEVDAVIAPLLFSFAGDHERETLHKVKAHPAHLFPTHTLYQRLAEAGVKSHMFMPKPLIHTTYSQAVFKGAQTHGFKTLSEALVNLSEAVLQTQTTGSAENATGARHYFYLYFADIDTLAHDYGPSSPQVTAQIENFLWTFEHHFLNRVAGKAGKTLLMMVADHGQVDTPPEDTYFLNLKHPDIAESFMLSRSGAPIVPAGSPRDMFLYVKPHLLDAVQAMLRTALAGRAEVYTTQSLIAQGIFGNDISQRFIDRVGNLVVLSQPGQSVWWYEKDRFENELRGHHGGLDRAEMETPLILFDLG